jgi:hypothetical protein
MAIRYQVATILRIKELLKYVDQKEADSLLGSRDF